MSAGKNERWRCDLLLSDCRICIQPVSYPTVPRGSELRITPWAYHDDGLIDPLSATLVE